jgi:hypothetical protein
MLEIFISDGEGEPYIVVPEQFKIAIFEWLKDKIPCTFPRSGGVPDGLPMNAVMELVDTSVKEAEKPTDKWFEILSIQPEKLSYGAEDNPTSLSWRFDPITYRQAQTEWLENYRYEQSQKSESVYSI